MGKVNKHKIQGMSWFAKTGLVLLLTLATTLLLGEGWLLPATVQAAVTRLDVWPALPQINNTTTSPSTTTFSPTSGVNRIVIVSVQAHTNSTTVAAITGTYGGSTTRNLRPIVNSPSNQRRQVWFFYLNEADLAAVNGTTLRITNTITGSGYSVYVSTYAGVDQGTPITATDNLYNNSSGSTNVVTLNANAGGFAIYADTHSLNEDPTNNGGFTKYPSDAVGSAYSFAADVATAGNINPTFSYSASLYCGWAAISLNPYIASDTTPPIAGTVSINPDIASNYTSSAPTITTQFTDLESAVTACQYTTNGGTTWTAGVVSGAGPYTCTASPSGLSGALTINMRATSTGGTGTATAITRTVDTSVPTDGTLTATSGNLQNSLSWTAATDAGSGISSYILRFATGATAPASCAVGSAVPGSPFSAATLSATHTGLSNGTQYSYRLCATDNSGNTSAGTTAIATPTAVTATITSCSACHGYKTTFPDGASRNAGGLFQGSHNKHVIAQAIVCSACHVAPATETSADYGHSTGFVQMASPLSGGSYSKASPFGVSNTFTPGTCSGTSCHAAVYATTSGTSPSWGTPGGGCGACHNTTPGVFQANGAPNTGGHNIHMTAGAACGNCHAGTVSGTSGGANHGNGVINVVNGYNGGVPATKRAAGGTYYTCTTASCHADPYSAGTVMTNVWSSISSGCGACHKNAANNGNLGAFITYSAPSTQSGPATASHDEHLNYNRYVCGDCHAGAVSGTSGGTNHGNGVVNIIQYAGTVVKHQSPFTYLANGCAAACHITATWGSQLGCINCHASPITRRKGRPGDVLDAVTTEFGLAWGHKRTGRGAVTDADCIVCHLEGNGTTKRTSKYHADGNIDLRDPAGVGEVAITNISGGVFTFQRFSTSYAAGSRTSTGHTANSIDNVITQKFCLGCHKSGGATNTTARTPGGTATMPFGGINLGVNYTVANGAAAAGGLVDVNTEFATTNSSYHPVRGPLNRDYPTAARLNAPYNNQVAGRTDVGNVKTLSVVIYCSDCHNKPATPLTLRTVTAHGNANSLRGTYYVSSPTLCILCHSGYNVAPGSNTRHGAGSALSNGNLDGGENVSSQCQNCHSSASAMPARPRAAQDYHGYNSLVGGGLWPTINSRPYAFIRSWSGTAYHRPFRSSEFTTGSATCGAGTCPGGGQVGDGGTRTYTPGGSY